MRYFVAGVSFCALVPPAYAADEYWTRSFSVAERVGVIQSADPASMDKPMLQATLTGLLANVLFDVKTGNGYTASNMGSYRVTGSACITNINAITRSFSLGGSKYDATARTYVIDWKQVENISVRGMMVAPLPASRSEARGPANSVQIDINGSNPLNIYSGTAKNAEQLFQTTWKLKLACLPPNSKAPPPVYKITPQPTSTQSSTMVAPPPPIAPPPPRAITPPPPPPPSPPPTSLRAPTRDELSSINIGGENLKSRMVREPLFASSVPQASRNIAGCLKLDTDTGGVYIRRILNVCIFPISITGTLGKPRAFREECDAIEPSKTFVINAFENFAIGQAPKGAVFGYSSFCFSEISNISVVGPTFLPADPAAAHRILSTMWNGTGALLQFSEYDPMGDESRIIKGSSYSNICKTDFDATQLKNKYGAAIKNNRTSIDWSIPGKLEIHPEYDGKMSKMGKLIYVIPLNQEKYSNNPAIWFDDVANTLKASRAIAVLISRCGSSGR